MPANLPEGRSLHVNRPLTNVSTAYAQDTRNFIADRIFPVINVTHQGDFYHVYNKGDWFRSVAGVRAPATESVGAGWDLSTSPYFAPVYAVHKDLDDQTRANADAVFNLEADAARWVTMNLLIKRDRIFVDSYMKTGVWSRNLTGVGSAPGANQFLQWNVAGSTPIENVTNEVVRMAGQTGFRPNTLVMGPDVWNVLRNHTQILDRIRYTQRAMIGMNDTDLLAQAFGVDRVIVTWAVENTAPYGATDAFAFQNAKTMLLAYAPDNPGLMQPAAGYIFAWSGLLGAGAMGTRINRFRMEPIQSWRVEGEMAFDMKVIGADLGVFYDSVVA